MANGMGNQVQILSGPATVTGEPAAKATAECNFSGKALPGAMSRSQETRLFASANTFGGKGWRRGSRISVLATSSLGPL